ncbi:sensor histidine kinase [Sphingomonas sp. ID0503]|uniref:sensor histidine kinase n=1 Tax=Sphingomonas sp. ID0503 TaxID=3399691 RepID=UPI003AFACAFC
MRRLIARLSLHARLLIIAALTTVAALAFAAMSIGTVLERVVVRGLDRQLDAQIMILSDAIMPNGGLDGSRVVELPGFSRDRHGWSWRVRTPAGQWTSAQLPIARAELNEGRLRRDRLIRSGWGKAADGTPLHIRQMKFAKGSGTVEITATAPRSLVERPLRSALQPLFLSLLLLGVALLAATLAQLRYGLRPLRLLREEVTRVRSGTLPRLSTEHPRELQPLAEEVNALIDQNEAGLEHARRHVANLAHGLKTPLATLSLQLARDNAAAETRALVDQLDARIAHHLRRARSAAPGGTRSRTEVAAVAEDLVGVLRHLSGESTVTFELRIEPTLSVLVDRQDLDEVLGNLLENAARHARSVVVLSASRDGQLATIVIEDDGVGLDPDQAVAAVQPGQRLDESGIGYGFGLAIVRELVELYGGSLAIERSEELGGLAARITLPAAAPIA